MGAGKTTIGKLLAKALKRRFYDTDHLVIKGFGNKSVPRIFAENGEPAFRQAEKLVLAELCKRSDFVASTGGGTLVRPDTMEMALANGVVIYLQAPIEVLFDRVIHSVKDRPILAQQNTEQAFRERFEAREAFYQMAHIHVSTDTAGGAAIAGDVESRDARNSRDLIVAEIIRQMDNLVSA
ncbi:MAG: shikimate kinase [Vampirovibrionales bacterium]|nr:shikimate kinase [Vampirovibrionales bacterium]